jgi:hypothetical protein
MTDVHVSNLAHTVDYLLENIGDQKIIRMVSCLAASRLQTENSVFTLLANARKIEEYINRGK